MSVFMRVKRSMGVNLLLVAATAGVSLASVVRAADKAGQGAAITAEEQPDGRTRLMIKTSSKPTFTTWKLEHPSRVVVDVSGVQLSGVQPFDAGTFAVGNVSATTSGQAGEGKARITLTLRRGADYQVEAKGNAIVVDVTPWEAPPVVAKTVSPEVVAAAKNEAQQAAQAKSEAETRAAAAEARAAKAEQESQRLAKAQQQAEVARQEAAEDARLAAVAATQTLAEEKAALEASQARAQAAQVQAERMAASLAAERAAMERARKGVAVAEKAALAASQAATEGQRKEEQQAAKRAAEHLAKERAALEQRQQQAEASERAAAAAMQRLAQEKQAVEQRQKQSETARLSALEAAKRLQRDQQKANEARLEAERLRATAQQTELKAKELLRLAETAQKQAEARQKQAEKTGKSADAQVAAAVAEARKQTEQARAAAVLAQSELSRLDAQRKQMAVERENLNAQQKALGEAERQALLAHKRAAEITAKAVEVQAEMARLESEKQAFAKQQLALSAQQAQLAAAEKDTAAQRKALDAKAEAQQDEERRLAAFEQAMKSQKSALAQTSVEQERQQARLSQAEQELLAAKAELERREQALAAAQKQSESAPPGKDTKAQQAKAEQAKLEQAKVELQQALSAHAEAERHRQSQEQKLAALAAERQSLESTRGKLENELQAIKGELASARAEVARLKAAPVAVAPAPKVASTATPAPAAPVVASPEQPRVVAASAPSTTPRPRSVTLRVPSRVSRIDFVDEPGRSSVIIDTDEPIEFSVQRSTGRRVTLRLHHADLPRVLERSLDATQFFGPVRLINSYRDPADRAAVLVEVELAEMVPNRVRTDGARLYWDFDKNRPGSAAQLPIDVQVLSPTKVAAFSTMTLPFLVAQERPVSSSQRSPANRKRFTGRRIDLDFKGADIHNILRLLAEVGGVNIVTSDDVKGEVTIKMRDVPWDQALDVVLRAKTLGQIREGNLIRVAPIQVLEKELEQEIAKQKQMTEVMPTETRLIGVSYAEAKELEARAKDLLSGRGKVSVDDRTNNLIVSDVAKNLALVEELVRNLDTQTSQVIIEARIVEARSTFVRQIGVQWGGTTFMDAEHGNPTGLAFPNSIGVAGGATDQLTNNEGLVPGPRTGLAGIQSPNYAVNLPAAVGTGSGGALGLTLGSIAGALNLNLRLSALEQSGQVRILSSPRITTMDNVQASIEQGVAIPISVVSAQGVQTVFVDAKLNLTVKPHVTNEGTVMMNVHVTRNEPDFVNTGARGDPTILKKEAKTMMLVRDGDTAVIGGIYQRNSGLNYGKVPFFADIPIVGFFFRTRRENDDRTEFLVFITPRIANRSRSLAQ